jgi:hypothetical protein
MFLDSTNRKKDSFLKNYKHRDVLKRGDLDVFDANIEQDLQDMIEFEKEVEKEGRINLEDGSQGGWMRG